MRPTLFSQETLARAEKLEPELDGILPGTWHVLDEGNEYHVQTDEEIEDWHPYWASCSCPRGVLVPRGIPRCSHVAAVFMALLGE